MKNMRTLVFAALACALSSTAQAAVYEMVNPVRDAATLEVGARAPVFRLEVSDAAIARGSFTYSVAFGSGFEASVPTGDVADFISVAGGLGGYIDAQDPYLGRVHPFLRAEATFAADGSILTSRFDFYSYYDEFYFSGSSASFGGTYGSDDRRAQGCSFGGCRATGNLVLSGFTPATAVPEPATMALLAVGLFGVAAVRRHRPG